MVPAFFLSPGSRGNNMVKNMEDYENLCIFAKTMREYE